MPPRGSRGEFPGTPLRRPRLAGIDTLRGLVMVLMALDHVRDNFGNVTLTPEDMASTTPLLFATRWVTHFCAPVFVFLAGVSAWLYGRTRSRGQLAHFLVTRGVWLIVLEGTVIFYAWMMTFRLGFVFLQVIAAIGAGMVVLAGVIWLPGKLRVALALAIVFGHNLLDGRGLADAGNVGALIYGAFHPIIIDGAPRVLVIYALLPWTGVMLLGYVAGPLFVQEENARRRTLFWCGIAATVAFVLLRFAGVYGDPTTLANHLTAARDAGRATGAIDLIAFLNCTKYPPSLLFLLMTLGPAFIFLAFANGPPGRVSRALIVFGRVPLFYYIVHLFVIHLGARSLYRVVHGEFYSPLEGVFTGNIPPWFGFGLEVVYAAWVVIVLALYPVCAWYGRVKRAGSSPLWSYL